MAEDVQKHSVHTLVFRSLKRTHDMFVSDHAKSVAMDEESHKLKMSVKMTADYSAVLHMPVLKEGKDRMSLPGSMLGHQSYTQPGDDPDYLITGTHAYPSGPGVALTADTTMHRNPSEGGIHSMALALPPSQARLDVSRTAASSLLEGGGTRNSTLARKAPTMPKPQWHPPWKLFRVISGHLGWVRSIAVEPGNQWFVTGSADRTIKIWDLASGKLKLSLTGHISTVRGVAVSNRSPYLFSCGEDKQVKCWDLEYNKVIRHYHGHLSAVYDIDLHPTIDVLVTCSRDATARVWDIRTKANVHTLTGHTNTVATVRCQAAEPQVITDTLLPPVLLITSSSGCSQMATSSRTSDNGTIHLWDWRTGYNFQRIHAAVQPGSLDSESGIFACMFDNSESRLITAEADKTIKVYKEDDTATEETHPVNWKPEILKRKRF
ncbi:hypothetical protein FQN60_011747 [Etheostoma spectabile]|uniref:Uncharacterized protein n=1 Tax=Etheostoma spectabile TaxID=54343 RepID=A0A5J5DN05_9PERO|nr:hypothetical protein FQN60_011747 [Etheostoma spectabile]